MFVHFREVKVGTRYIFGKMRNCERQKNLLLGNM